MILPYTLSYPYSRLFTECVYCPWLIPWLGDHQTPPAIHKELTRRGLGYSGESKRFSVVVSTGLYVRSTIVSDRQQSFPEKQRTVLERQRNERQYKGQKNKGQYQNDRRTKDNLKHIKQEMRDSKRDTRNKEQYLNDRKSRDNSKGRKAKDNTGTTEKQWTI